MKTKQNSRQSVNFLETTHGVVKPGTEKLIIFVSAITDRLVFFDLEVTASQNYAASFNAGIVSVSYFVR